MIIQKPLTFNSQPIDTTPQSFGELRRSADALDNVDELRRRFQVDGYLYLPGLLDREMLWSARMEMLAALAELDFVDLDYPLADGVAKREFAVSAQSMKDLSKNNEPLRQALYDGPMVAFYERFFGGAVRPLDFTWCRVKSSGAQSGIKTATSPHCDIVFMGRGTKNLIINLCRDMCGELYAPVGTGLLLDCTLLVGSNVNFLGCHV